MSTDTKTPDKFGHTTLPPDVAAAMRRARTLEIVTLGWMVLAVTAMALTMGSSQAMKAAWLEDMLSFLPPIAFLVALRQSRRQPDDEHRFGFHRAIGAGHLAASVALLGMGVFVVYEGASTLLMREHPTVGTVRLFGHTLWLGWLMIAVLLITNIPSVVLGRLKLPVSEQLHDKILFADADMNKADWQTAAGAIAGIIGIGLGWWWADSAVAVFIGAGIVRDGVSNLRAALRGLLDHQAMTHDDADALPLIAQVERYFAGIGWADDVWVRMRDQGHVMHTEVFVKTSGEVPRALVKQAVADIRSLDWKLQDTVVVCVDEFPHVEAEDC